MKETLSRRLRHQRGQSLATLSLCWSRLFEMEDRRDRFLCYLVEIYYYVKFSCPLMQRVHDRLPPDAGSIRRYLARHIEEEHGHEQWVLSDLEKLGISPDRVKARLPMRETMALVGAQLYMIDHVEPTAYFGYVYAMESSAASTQAVEKLSEELDIPLNALFTLTEHAALDWTHHVTDLESVLDACFTTSDRQALIERNYVITMELFSDLVLGLCDRKDIQAALVGLRDQGSVK